MADISKTNVTGKSRSQKQSVVQQKEEAAKAAVAPRITQITPANVLGSSRGRKPVTGRIVLLPCPLYPEYTDEEGDKHPPLVVGFKVDNEQKYLNELPNPALVTVQEYLTKTSELMALIAPVFRNWDFLHPVFGSPIPCPDPQNPDSYLVLLNPTLGLEQLAVWIGGLGIATAAAVALGQPSELVERFFMEQTDLGATLQAMRDAQAAPIGGPGYDAALEASLPPNSESA